jgi:hypothetical protein
MSRVAGALAPSLLVVEYRSVPPAASGTVSGGTAVTALRVRLQQPTLVLDLSLLLRLAGFVAPSSELLTGVAPRAWSSREVLLDRQPHRAQVGGPGAGAGHCSHQQAGLFFAPWGVPAAAAGEQEGCRWQAGGWRQPMVNPTQIVSSLSRSRSHSLTVLSPSSLRILPRCQS